MKFLVIMCLGKLLVYNDRTVTSNRSYSAKYVEYKIVSDLHNVDTFFKIYQKDNNEIIAILPTKQCSIGYIKK